MMKICADHHETHVNKGENRRLLTQIARMKLLANPGHMELWKMMKKLRRLYCVPNKNFSYE
jgi:hypothetical protein